MGRSFVSVAVVLVAWPLAAADTPSMKVLVSAAQVEARKDVDDATKAALKAKKDAAKEARKAKEKELKGQLGKKRDTWPPEKDEELYVLEEAEALARADYEYRKIDQKGLKDSVGGKMDPARFAKIPREYRIRKGFGWGIFKIAGPSDDNPVFRFETNNMMTSGAWGSFGCFGTAANAASAAVDKFIEDNFAILTSTE